MLIVNNGTTNSAGPHVNANAHRLTSLPVTIRSAIKMMLFPSEQPDRFFRMSRLSQVFSAAVLLVTALTVEAATTDPLGKALPALNEPLPIGFTSHIADLGSAKIHYVVGGSGPPMLLIHGWPESWYEWRKVMPIMAAHYTVIAADLRGIGGSSLEPSGYDKKTLAADMHRLMLKLGYSKATVIGHDWGGPTAYAYAAQYRDAVDKLVMIEGSPFGPWMKDTNISWFFSFMREPGYAETVLPGREREYLRYFYVNKQQHVVPVFDERTIAIYSSGYARPGRMNASYGLYRSIDQDVQDNTGFAQQPLTIPVLAIGAEKGAGDVAFTNARAVAANVTPCLFKQTGHFVPEERPEVLAGVILDFLDGKSVPAEWAP